MKKKTLIKLTAWLLAIGISILAVVLYFSVSGLDGGLATQLEKGELLLAEGDYEGAVKHFLKAADIAPSSPVGYLKAAQTYVAMEDPDSAIALMEEYIATRPRSVESFDYLLALYETVGTPLPKQLEVLTAAAELFPSGSFAERAGAVKLKLAVVEDPIPDPLPGSYEDALTVTISNLAEGDVVYYTTNGDEPNQSATLYDREKGISVKKGRTQLMLIRYDAEGRMSGVVSALYAVGEGLTAEQLMAYTSSSPNLATGGNAIFGGTDSYFANANDSGRLYSAASGLVSEDRVSYLNLANGYLYYVNSSDSGRIYRIKPDGSGRERISERSVGSLLTAGDRMFFQNKEDGALYSATLAGSSRQRITGDLVSAFTVHEGVIYYRNDSEGGALWRCSIDGFDAQELVDSAVLCPAVSSGYVYYIDAGGDGSIWKVLITGGEPVRVTSGPAKEFVLSGGNLYYRGEDGLFRCPAAGGSSTRLSSGDGARLSVIGSTVYFIDYSNGSKMTSMTTSGEGKSVVKTAKDVPVEPTGPVGPEDPRLPEGLGEPMGPLEVLGPDAVDPIG
ncbi:MAG: DUF5050 domain-containing protein [Clostridia bacterium]|nr:DUF5050 domain-containing protein [Clostridia bacterium]